MGLEHRTQELGLVRVDGDGKRLLLGQFDDGAVVGREPVMREEPRLEQTGRARPILEQRFLLRFGRKRKGARAGRRSAKLQRQPHRARLRSVIPHGNEDLPNAGIGGRAPQSDLSQPAVFRRVGDGDDSQVGYRDRRERSGLPFGDAARAYKHNLSGAPRAQLLNLAGEVERLLEVQRCRARFGCGHGPLDRAVVRFERGCRSGQRVGAHEHDAIARGKRSNVGGGSRASFVHQRPGPARLRSGGRSCSHPGRCLEDQDMIEGRSTLRSDPQLSDGEQQQADADKLQEQRPGLLDPFPRGDHGGLLGGYPESQRGDGLLAPGAVEEIERHHDGGNRAEQRGELDESQVEKEHAILRPLLSRAPALRR